jgi:hypothetical protein
MIKCVLCGIEIKVDSDNNPKNIGLLRNNAYYCIPCYDVALFTEDLNDLTSPTTKPVEKKETVTPKKTQSLSRACCYKCNKPYENNKCTDCNITNPLCLPRKKNKPKKKKKKNK